MDNFFSTNLTYLREKRNLSQAEMPAALGFGRTTWNGYENDKSKPNFSDLLKISTFFDVGLSDLVEKDLSKGNLNASSKESKNQEKGNLKGNRIGNLKADSNEFSLLEERSEVYTSSRYNVYDLESAAAAGQAMMLVADDMTKPAPNMYLPELGSGLHLRMSVRGDSMHPTIRDGDKSVATWVNEPSHIRYGHVHLIIDKEDGVVCKRVYFHDKKSVELVSDNEVYKPYRRAWSDILAIFIVRQVHTTDLRPYLNDVRRDIREMKEEMADFRRLLVR